MNKIVLFFTALCCVMVALNGCYYDNAEDLYPMDIDTVITFSDDIQPFITRTCATSSGCHASGASNPVFESYDQIKTNIDRIEARAIVEESMPPSGPKPTPQELVDLKHWIDSGAPND